MKSQWRKWPQVVLLFHNLLRSRAGKRESTCGRRRCGCLCRRLRHGPMAARLSTGLRASHHWHDGTGDVDQKVSTDRVDHLTCDLLTLTHDPVLSLTPVHLCLVQKPCHHAVGRRDAICKKLGLAAGSLRLTKEAAGMLSKTCSVLTETIMIALSPGNLKVSVRCKKYAPRSLIWDYHNTSHFTLQTSHLTPHTSHLTPLTSHLLLNYYFTRTSWRPAMR